MYTLEKNVKILVLGSARLILEMFWRCELSFALRIQLIFNLRNITICRIAIEGVKKPKNTAGNRI